MPGYKTHLTGGCIIFLALSSLLVRKTTSYLSMIEWLLCALLGALFPDIDVKSKGQLIVYKIVCGILLFLLLRQRFALFAMLSFAGCMPLMVKHRGIFHSLSLYLILSLLLIAYMILYMPCYYLCTMHDCLFFIAGVISHLWLDMPTKRWLKLR